MNDLYNHCYLASFSFLLFWMAWFQNLLVLDYSGGQITTVDIGHRALDQSILLKQHQAFEEQNKVTSSFVAPWCSIITNVLVSEGKILIKEKDGRSLFWSELSWVKLNCTSHHITHSISNRLFCCFSFLIDNYKENFTSLIKCSFRWPLFWHHFWHHFCCGTKATVFLFVCFSIYILWPGLS